MKSVRDGSSVTPRVTFAFFQSFRVRDATENTHNYNKALAPSKIKKNVRERNGKITLKQYTRAAADFYALCVIRIYYFA